MEQLMQQTPNPELIEELKDNLSPKFNYLFKQIMVNYYLSLLEEVKRQDQMKNQAAATQFEIHIVEILDCLDLEKMFRVDKLFNFP